MRFLVALLAISLRVLTIQAIDLSQCIAPLGMESGAILNENIAASSSFDSKNVGPQHARMRQEHGGGAWCPKPQITKEPKEWIEINFQKVHMITATGSQGRFGNGQGVEFAEAYMLEYWRPRLGKWFRYRDFKGEEVITGNSNTYLEAKYTLNPPIWASKVRFLPFSYHLRTVCMRVEVYGCDWNDGIVSYSMPQGDKRGTGWEFYDASYDGIWDGELKRGLGQLTDGIYGPDNFKAGYYDHGLGWVGWRNDTRDGRPIEIKFEFDTVREFTMVHLFCNNQFMKDIQVFAEAKIWFSIGGKYYTGEPITYAYMEDHIFETSRNVSVKLHHRIGKFVKIQLTFAAKWIMLSEIMFESDVANGNFTEESLIIEKPLQSDDTIAQNDTRKFQKSNTKQEVLPGAGKPEDATYMAVIIGILMAIIFILAMFMFVIVNRHRQRKYFASSLGPKCTRMDNGDLSSTYTTVEKSNTSVKYAGQNIIDDYADVKRLPPDATLRSMPYADRNLIGVKFDDYQEPYQALKYAPYYSYSAVVTKNNGLNPADISYEYAVPELGTRPLLAPDVPIIHENNSIEISSKSSCKSNSTNSTNQYEILNNMKRRREELIIPEFPRHRLRMISKLAEGAFGTVYVAEADRIPEYGSRETLGTRQVAVKFLMQGASETEKQYFHRDVRILAALEDENIARVLGLCSTDDPLCVVMEYLEHGDLCTFLKNHIHGETGRNSSLGIKTLNLNSLLYIATQIASGMRYLESLNFVHRDLATRNCLVGKNYQIKISDFGTDNEAYATDYYKVDGTIPLPVRWMSWESVFQGKYTTKSDVWSFAVTLWEILTLARRRPFENLSDAEVLENLESLQRSNSFAYLPRPALANVKDIYDLMCECWKINENDRPTFCEIHLFLQRKNLGYAP